ncbi:MAG TPA: hypothetical protein VL989_02220 [Candidatus Sulfotelmatobacter sp.]|nr:hypothetical protein [Candidatus Sulfotelmatobacter sp.]
MACTVPMGRRRMGLEGSICGRFPSISSRTALAAASTLDQF